MSLSGFYSLDQFIPKIQLESHASSIIDEILRIPIENMLPWHENSILSGEWFLQPILLHDVKFGNYSSVLLNTFELLSSLGCIQAGISVLKPNSKILPHTDDIEDDVLLSKKSYRLQLGISIPENCSLTVFNKHNEPETRQWENGKVLAFDSSQMHSATNQSDKNRIVLIADFDKGDLISENDLQNLKHYYLKLYGLIK